MIASDFTSGQISALARRNGQPLRHAAYGFYLARVLYRFTIHELSGMPEGCAPEFQVAADLALVGRRIEVASDLKPNTCLFPIALGHYRRHADADARAFAEFAPMIPDRVQAAVVDRGAGDPANEAAFRRDVTAAFDGVLRLLDRSRQEAQAAVDGAPEVDRLTHPGCSAQGPSRPPPAWVDGDIWG